MELTAKQKGSLDDLRSNLAVCFPKVKTELAQHLTQNPDIAKIRQILTSTPHTTKPAKRLVKHFKEAFDATPDTVPKIRAPTDGAGKTPKPASTKITLASIVDHLMQREKKQ